MKAIRNAKIISGENLIHYKTLVFDETIAGLVDNSDLGKFNIEEMYDAEENYVASGFIDIHTHGCNNSDTMDGTIEALENISMNVAKGGVTSLLPTTMTMQFEYIHKALECIRQLQHKSAGAQVLGGHLEGPFINKQFKGCHNEEYIITPSFELISKYKDCIKLITIAPELDGCRDFINYCNQSGIKLSMGHSAASYEAACKAIEDGISSTTHTFNGMTAFNHRKPGVLGAALEGDVYCELIADNIHVHPAVQRLLLKTKTIDKIILVTDAMRACMLEDGDYELGGKHVKVAEGTARLADGTLAGSIITLNKAVRNFMNNTNIDIVSAVKTVTINPAKMLGIENKKGTIEAGKDADIVVFDKNINIIKTISKGKVIYRRK